MRRAAHVCVLTTICVVANLCRRSSSLLIAPKTSTFVVRGRLIDAVGPTTCPRCRRTTRLRNDGATTTTTTSSALDEIEATVDKALRGVFVVDAGTDLSILPAPRREAVGVARRLRRRLSALRRNDDCPVCWLQRAHCVCSEIRPLEDRLSSSLVRRVFVLTHHKEIGMKIDTAKLIAATFPKRTRVVVGGVGPEHQESMREMTTAIGNGTCLVLFPDDDARTLPEILDDDDDERTTTTTDGDGLGRPPFDLVVVDGTWAQARKLLARYVPTHVPRVRLGTESLERLAAGEGHQLRRHSTTWRQVGTFEALRLCLGEVCPDIALRTKDYQRIANDAALKELGPPRRKAESNDGSDNNNNNKISEKQVTFN